MSRGRSAMATHWPARGPLRGTIGFRWQKRGNCSASSRGTSASLPHTVLEPSNRGARRRLLASSTCAASSEPPRAGPPLHRSDCEAAQAAVRPLRVLHISCPHRRRGVLTPRASRSPRSDLKSISPRPSSPSIGIVFTPLSTAPRRVDQPVEWLAAYGPSFVWHVPTPAWSPSWASIRFWHPASLPKPTAHDGLSERRHGQSGARPASTDLAPGVQAHLPSCVTLSLSAWEPANGHRR